MLSNFQQSIKRFYIQLRLIELEFQMMQQQVPNSKLLQNKDNHHKVDEPQSQLLCPSQQQQASSNKKGHQKLDNIILISASILIFIGGMFYMIAIITLQCNSTQKQKGNANLNLTKFTDNQKVGKQVQQIRVKRKQYKKQLKEEGNPNPNFQVKKWIEIFKNLSTEITVQKLLRAQNILLNFSQPISPSFFQEQRQFYTRDYQIHQYEEKPICIVVPTFNNTAQERYKHNIDSIMGQQYTNYRVIFIDDASGDQTGQKILQYLKVKNFKAYLDGRISVKINPERKMALPNIIYAAKNFCQPEDIMMIVDGDDYLLGKLVFKLFNSAFSLNRNWVVYSNFLTTDGKVGFSRRYPAEIIESRQFRRVLFIISHLRAFYTKLFLLINEEDFFDEKGQYFRAANDVAIFMPILEMASQHISYLHEICYYYNSKTGMNNHEEKKKEQIDNDRYIRQNKKYKKLATLFDDRI